MADAGEHVLEGTPGGPVVKDLGRGHQRQAVPAGAQDRAGLLFPLLGPVMAGDQGVEPVPEGLFQQLRHGRGVGIPCDQAPFASPEGDKPVRMLAHLLPGHAAFSFWGAQSAAGKEAAEVRVAGAIHGQQDQGGLRPGTR